MGAIIIMGSILIIAGRIVFLVIRGEFVKVDKLSRIAEEYRIREKRAIWASAMVVGSRGGIVGDTNGSRTHEVRV